MAPTRSYHPFSPRSATPERGSPSSGPRRRPVLASALEDVSRSGRHPALRNTGSPTSASRPMDQSLPREYPATVEYHPALQRFPRYGPLRDSDARAARSPSRPPAPPRISAPTPDEHTSCPPSPQHTPRLPPSIDPLAAALPPPPPDAPPPAACRSAPAPRSLSTPACPGAPSRSHFRGRRSLSGFGGSIPRARIRVGSLVDCACVRAVEVRPAPAVALAGGRATGRARGSRALARRALGVEAGGARAVRRGRWVRRDADERSTPCQVARRRSTLRDKVARGA